MFHFIFYADCHFLFILFRLALSHWAAYRFSPLRHMIGLIILALHLFDTPFHVAGDVSLMLPFWVALLWCHCVASASADSGESSADASLAFLHAAFCRYLLHFSFHHARHAFTRRLPPSFYATLPFMPSFAGVFKTPPSRAISSRLPVTNASFTPFFLLAHARPVCILQDAFRPVTTPSPAFIYFSDYACLLPPALVFAFIFAEISPDCHFDIIAFDAFTFTFSAYLPLVYFIYWALWFCWVFHFYVITNIH